MPVLIGELEKITGSPSSVTQVMVRAHTTRITGAALTTDELVPIPVDRQGRFEVPLRPGKAVLVLVHGGRVGEGERFPMLVEEGLGTIVSAIKLASDRFDDYELDELERAAADMLASLDRGLVAATTAQEIATNLPATIQNELDDRVPPEVAEALSTDQTIRDAATLAVNDAVDAGLPGKADTSYVDAQDQALGQRVDWAQRAAANLGPVETGTIEDTAWAQVTEDGHRLPLGYTPEGRLDDHARAAFHEDINQVYPSADDEYAHVLTTEGGHLLLGFRKDGTITAPGLPTTDGGGEAPPAVQERWVTPDGTIAPVQADTATITGWGSSSLSGMAPELRGLLSPLGVSYQDHARSGEEIEHIAARMGAVQAIIAPVTIPASGAVPVTSDNLPVSNRMRPYAGWLGGVHGTLSSTADTLTFTRTTAGTATQLTAPTEFISEVGTASRGHVTIISAGKNNVGTTGAVELILDYTDRMVRHLTPMFPRLLVMGHFMDTNTTVGGTEWTQIQEVNAALARRYGDLYIDHLGIVTGPDIWDRTGITPTADDLTAQAELRLPPSLARDNYHHNDQTDAAIAEIIVEHLTGLGWY